MLPVQTCMVPAPPACEPGEAAGTPWGWTQALPGGLSRLQPPRVLGWACDHKPGLQRDGKMGQHRLSPPFHWTGRLPLQRALARFSLSLQTLRLAKHTPPSSSPWRPFSLWHLHFHFPSFSFLFPLFGAETWDRALCFLPLKGAQPPPILGSGSIITAPPPTRGLQVNSAPAHSHLPQRLSSCSRF